MQEKVSPPPPPDPCSEVIAAADGVRLLEGVSQPSAPLFPKLSLWLPGRQEPRRHVVMRFHFGP